MTRTAIIIASVAAALLSGSIAHAAADSDTVQVKVSYSDLNLASPDGAKALYARIETASRNACSALADDRSLDKDMQYRSCHDSYVAKLTSQIDALIPSQVAAAEPAKGSAH